ncbi:MAG: nucleoside-diphosphate sugar epimerase [Rhodomicrobium sp.]|nr:MAG: nucleoside-diphosphate sugar epimerase [Rhodomicrobium sp.]
MKCLVAGAYGFIGQAIVRALLKAGHEVVGAGRDVALGQRLLPEIAWLRVDYNERLSASDWVEDLAGVDAVINAVGILQSDLRDKASYVHGQGAAALFQGAEAAGVHRLIHISATTIGELPEDDTDADLAVKNPLSEYAASKLAGERALRRVKLSSLIIRPDFVIGHHSSGGALLLRGLSGLPFVVPLPGAGGQRFQPVMIDDLAELVVKMVAADRLPHADRQAPLLAGEPEMIYAVGPEVRTLREMILSYRRWLGFAGGYELRVPLFLLKLMAMAGDVSSLLGNRGALRSASLEQMESFELHDAAPFEAALGRPLTSMSDYLNEQPASLSDRVHARTYFWVPLLILGVALTWMFEGYEQLVQISHERGFGTLALAGSLTWEGVAALLSILSGVFFLSRRWRRIGGMIKIALIVGVGLLHVALITSVTQGVGLALSIVVPVLLIAVLMSFSESR